MEQTKAEVLLGGLEQMRDGLQTIGKVGGNRDQLLVMLVGSERTVRNFREALTGDPLMKNVVYSLVASKVNRLSQESVEKVLDTFFSVLFDLAKPYEPPKPQTPAR